MGRGGIMWTPSDVVINFIVFCIVVFIAYKLIRID